MAYANIRMRDMRIPDETPRPIASFRDLMAWKVARDLAIAVIRATSGTAFKHPHSFRDQMQRSAISVPSNIAEGDDRGSNRDTLRFLFIAKGSLSELRTQLDIAHEVGCLSDQDYTNLESAADRAARLISGLIKARNSREKND
jgi:four helix bundle protein